MADNLADWVEKVRRAEDLGYYSVSVPDHLGPSLPQWAPLIALAAVAPMTQRIRLAVTVLDNDFRHPIMLAKEAATLDVISNGRLDLGLGAGWLEEDYTKTGITTWDAPAVRVNRLIESIGLLRKLFSGVTVDHQGEHYQVSDYRSVPSPVQNPIPLMIGARGKRMLSMAAKEAQIVSILPDFAAGGNKLAGFERQLGWIEQAGGRERPDMQVGIRIPFGRVAGPGESGTTVAEQMAEQLKMPVGELLASPFIVAGDTSMIRDHLVAVVERYGTPYITISEHFAWALGPVVEELSR